MRAWRDYIAPRSSSVSTMPTTPSHSRQLGRLLWSSFQPDSVCWYLLLSRPSSDGALAVFGAKVSSPSEVPCRLFQVPTTTKCVKNYPHAPHLECKMFDYLSKLYWMGNLLGSMNAVSLRTTDKTALAAPTKLFIAAWNYLPQVTRQNSGSANHTKPNSDEMNLVISQSRMFLCYLETVLCSYLVAWLLVS